MVMSVIGTQATGLIIFFFFFANNPLGNVVYQTSPEFLIQFCFSQNQKFDSFFVRDFISTVTRNFIFNTLKRLIKSHLVNTKIKHFIRDR